MSSQNNATINPDDFRVPDDRLTCAPFDLAGHTALLGDDVFIAQERAEAALLKGFNTPGGMFVVGLASKNSAFLRNLRGKANMFMEPDKVCDMVSVRTFENLSRFRFINLAKGRAALFQQDIARLLETLQEAIPALLATESFREQEKAIRNQSLGKNQSALSALEKEEANTVSTGQFGELRFVHEFVPSGVTIYPVVAQGGRPLSHPEYDSLEESERTELDEVRTRLMGKVQEVMAEVRRHESEAEEEVEGLKRKSVEPLFMEKTEKIPGDYGAAVVAFLDGLRAHTLANLNAFIASPVPANFGASMGPTGHPDAFLPFKVDVFVDNSRTLGIPVLDHRNPSYEDIFGQAKTVLGPDGVPRVVGVEAGLLSKANGGLLVLSTQDVFGPHASMWGVWERLKAVLETKRLDIRSTRLNWYGTESTTGTASETLRVDVKLVLVGSETAYRLFNLIPDLKSEFDEVFRTVVHFSSAAPRSDEVVGQLKGFVRLLAAREGLPEVQDDAVEVFLRYLSSRAADQNKFRLAPQTVKDILEEAAWLAGDSAAITGEHVSRAIRDREYRVGWIRDAIHELTADGSILLSLDGSEVGQVNGLAVYDLGDISFGRPTRITAKTFAGRAGVINIEREADMSGRTHNKGVLILSGYLGDKFAQERPLMLSATLAFEQSYEGVDGDSASSAELYALLSSLSRVPLRQDIAVTGSVNQNGEIQPVGGVNQKIEGVFDVCSAFGLTGSQGVLIPHQNIKNLVLREDVIKAIKAREFHVYAARTIEEGIAILTGMEAGECDETGKYPEGTLYRLVDGRLEKLHNDLLRRMRIQQEDVPLG